MIGCWLFFVIGYKALVPGFVGFLYFLLQYKVFVIVLKKSYKCRAEARRLQLMDFCPLNLESKFYFQPSTWWSLDTICAIIIVTTGPYELDALDWLWNFLWIVHEYEPEPPCFKEEKFYVVQTFMNSSLLKSSFFHVELPGSCLVISYEAYIPPHLYLSLTSTKDGLLQKGLHWESKQLADRFIVTFYKVWATFILIVSLPF